MNDAPTETIGLRQAADLLGVHYMTAYRYVRSGRLPATKVGAEWQVDPADLQRLRDTPPARATGSVTPRAVHRDRLERRLIAGDEPGAWGVVESALGSGATPAEVLTRMLAPALRSIGERWAGGELSIADEHRASAVSQRLIARMGPQFARRGRRRATVVLGSAPGDRHSLPTAILSDLLRGEGIEVVDLGADCPAATFADAARAVGGPCAVGVCVTAPEVLEHTAELVDEVRRAGVECPIVVGGGAVTDAELAARLGADLWAGPIDEVVALFSSLASGLPTDGSPDAGGAGG
ncbi:MAG: cobalamin-dependent protein [Microthrixaceae bacterium]